jgi:hypothetical protein
MIGGFMSATCPIPKFYFQICQHRSTFSGVTIPATDPSASNTGAGDD